MANRQAHAERLDRQARKSQHNHAKALAQKLREKYGTTTVTMYESPKEENEVEVEKPECPECGEGLQITNKPDRYPSVKAECLNCDNTLTG
jgi:ribosomal protein S27AE